MAHGIHGRGPQGNHGAAGQGGGHGKIESFFGRGPGGGNAARAHGAVVGGVGDARKAEIIGGVDSDAHGLALADRPRARRGDKQRRGLVAGHDGGGELRRGTVPRLVNGNHTDGNGVTARVGGAVYLHDKRRRGQGGGQLAVDRELRGLHVGGVAVHNHLGPNQGAANDIRRSEQGKGRGLGVNSGKGPRNFRFLHGVAPEIPHRPAQGGDIGGVGGERRFRLEYPDPAAKGRSGGECSRDLGPAAGQGKAGNGFGPHRLVELDTHHAFRRYSRCPGRGGQRDHARRRAVRRGKGKADNSRQAPAGSVMDAAADDLAVKIHVVALEHNLYPGQVRRRSVLGKGKHRPWGPIGIDDLTW